jgi:hypothetical protein
MGFLPQTVVNREFATDRFIRLESSFFVDRLFRNKGDVIIWNMFLVSGELELGSNTVRHKLFGTGRSVIS